MPKHVKGHWEVGVFSLVGGVIGMSM